MPKRAKLKKEELVSKRAEVLLRPALPHVEKGIRRISRVIRSSELSSYSELSGDLKSIRVLVRQVKRVME